MLKFTADPHGYTWNDEDVDSITQILVAAGLIDTTWYDDESRDRGTIVHVITHEHDTGTLIEDELDPAYQGYLAAYKKFLKDTDCKILESEVPRYHRDLKYAGTPDKVAEFRKYISVFDIKSGGPSPWHPIQLSAQAEMVKQDYDVALVKRYSLYLKNDGTYRLEEHTSRQDTGVWQAIMAVHNWKKIHMKKGR